MSFTPSFAQPSLPSLCRLVLATGDKSTKNGSPATACEKQRTTAKRPKSDGGLMGVWLRCAEQRAFAQRARPLLVRPGRRHVHAAHLEDRAPVAVDPSAARTAERGGLEPQLGAVHPQDRLIEARDFR